MRSFLKIFLASLLALVVFAVLGFFILVGMISGLAGSLASGAETHIDGKAVLLVDLSESYAEKPVPDALAGFSESRYNTPGVYDVIRMIRYAKSDSAVKGIYIKANSNNNGFGTSEEIRNALLDFKKSGKFIIAYGETISFRAYYAANVADKVYCNPKGGVDWRGLTSTLAFIKGSLDKLEIEPEIFYAGKFKSATEPLRATKMTDANRLQLSELLNGLFNRILLQTGTARSQDTAVLRKCVDEQLVQTASDAVQYKLVDGLKYNDQVLNEIAGKIGVSPITSINFVPLGKYYEAVGTKMKSSGTDRIALIYAEGNIVGGKNSQREIGQDVYRQMIRKARLDKGTKAIVLRINSGGGSAQVSENLWRELTLAKADKPVVVSFGDVSASGGYYLSCNADSIYADPMTITGSIGVFSMLFNAQTFFKNKLGVTFDGVQTSRQPDQVSIVQPLTEMQKKFIQNDVDSIYHDFTQRVAEGRGKNISYIDSIGQGRIWSGEKALQLGLIDCIGGIQDAIDCAARMAKLTTYRIKEYPEPENIFDLLLNNYRQSLKAKAMTENLGEEGMKWYRVLSEYKALEGIPQARIPFELSLNP